MIFCGNLFRPFRWSKKILFFVLFYKSQFCGVHSQQWSCWDSHARAVALCSFSRVPTVLMTAFLAICLVCFAVFVKLFEEEKSCVYTEINYLQNGWLLLAILQIFIGENFSRHFHFLNNSVGFLHSFYCNKTNVFSFCNCFFLNQVISSLVQKQLLQQFFSSVV